MRTIDKIIIHCTANKGDISAAAVDRYHRSLGWNGIGYHYLIRTNGVIEPGRPLETVGSHCKGHNAHSIGIAYAGGINAKGQPADTRTPAQRKALKQLLAQLRLRYPGAAIYGHHDLNPHKACPCFNPRAEYGATL